MASDNKGYYKLLGLTPGASISEVKTTYRKIQAKLHPSGPERRKMRASEAYQKLSEKDKKAKEKELDDKISEINVAYSILSDEKKKQEYDSGMGDFGGFNAGGAGFGGFEDIFNMFSGGRGQERRRQQKVQDTVTRINISMAQAFVGKISKFNVNCAKVCSTCSGAGHKSVKTCEQCKGNGRVYIQRSMGMMITRQEAECDKCQGEGKVPSGPACATCKGAKVVKQPRQVDVRIRPGIKNGETIVMKGQGNHAPNKVPGDLIFQVAVEESINFKRIGDDLIFKADVDLSSILAGGYCYFDHLDGRKMAVKLGPVKMIKTVLCLNNEGFAKETGGKGDLYLNLNINVNSAQAKEFLKCGAQSATNKNENYLNVNGRYVDELPVEKHERSQEQYYEDASDEGVDPRQFFRGGFSFF